METAKTRRGPRSARPTMPRPGSKPLAYNFDRHGDLVFLDDDCGANVHPGDPLFYRALAMTPRAK